MNLKTKRIIKIIVFSIFFTNQVFAQFSGFALYNRQGNTTTYLIDENENIAHTWNLSTECNYTVLLKDNGNIVRGTKNNIQTGGTNNSLGGLQMQEEYKRLIQMEMLFGILFIQVQVFYRTMIYV